MVYVPAITQCILEADGSAMGVLSNASVAIVKCVRFAARIGRL
jgi:hypothetical protein